MTKKKLGLTPTPEFKVFKSTSGLGLKALRKFKKGTFLIEYTGSLITNQDADRWPNRYLFRLDEFHTIDGSPRSNLARYINHSCRPNAQAIHDEEKKIIYIEANKVIHIGEEITYDYGLDYFETYIKPFGCKCKKCFKKKE